ncbi:MAG: hypothetical protein CMG69_00235 [Candidatus Marinimicrobia bacterium]|nr:hypothetical protein [Candidatus Neomarinimicrobiota bacterium]|tara:strand:- start:12675 stop:14099 length:1425 start_codon:yes stop_codon:yes gene_type:complete
MFKKITENQSYSILFVACVISRIATSIYYIEDIDSLRFYLSLDDYNLSRLQPHFPGYPVFCFIATLLFLIIDSKGATFSLIGAVSVFVIIYYILKISKIKINNRVGIFCSFLIFFNPLIWLMSNRYMPDLMGFALAIVCLYYLTERRNRTKNLICGFIIIGLLSGVRLSYIPLIIIPFINHLIFHKQRVYLFISFIIGLLIWFLPLILITGYEDLYILANKQFIGHFTDFGGTFITENNLYIRFVSFLKSIWADGLGGYWPGRAWQTMILSISYIYFIYFGIRGIKNHLKNDENLVIIIYCVVLYMLWVFFFQNIVYKSRHIMPILILIFILVTIGQKYFSDSKQIFFNISSLLFFVALITITSNLVIQHKNPTAISKLKDSLLYEHYGITIISTPLINYYLKRHGVKGDFISVEDNEQIITFNSSGKDLALLIGSFENLFNNNYRVNYDSTYFHNPYVNRMWSAIETFKLEKK